MRQKQYSTTQLYWNTLSFLLTHGFTYKIKWYDIFPAFTVITEELMQQDTSDHLERPVRQLFQYLLTSDRRMKL